GEDRRTATALADETLAVPAGEDDVVVEEPGVEHRPVAAARAAGHHTGPVGGAPTHQVVRVGVVGRPGLAQLGERVVVDGDVVVDVAAGRAVHLDRRTVAAVVVGERVGARDGVGRHVGAAALEEHAEGTGV